MPNPVGVSCPQCGGRLTWIDAEEVGCFKCGLKWELVLDARDGDRFDADELGLDPEEEYDA